MIKSNGAAGEAGMGGPVAQRMQPNQSLKKGPWTAAEDAILVEYVKKHGEGNWNSVQKNSGLMRCGKSCRLRWANHLRPNLKKGSFTPEEERTIIELHAKLGNKWARMAAQLPGRTDNEIKNYWNTRMKRRQRAGLPIYPQEFQQEAAAIHFQNQQEVQQDQQQKHQNNSSFSSLLPSQKPVYSSSFPLFDPSNLQTSLNPLQSHHLFSSFYTNQSQFNNNNGGLTLPLSSVSPYAQSPPSTNMFNQNLVALPIQTQPPAMANYDDSDFENNNISFTSLIMGDEVDPNDYVPSLESEPPKSPIPFNTNVGGSTIERSGKNTGDNESETESPLATQEGRNSGLLDALVKESKSLSCKVKTNNGESLSLSSNKGKHVIMDEAIEGEVEERMQYAKRVKLSVKNGSETSGEDQCDDFNSFSQPPTGIKPSEEQPEEMNSMDDDLLSLLDNFPSSAPVPDWYPQSRNASNGSSSGEGTGEHNAEQPTSTATATDAAPNLEWALGSYCWNNMPGIC